MAERICLAVDVGGTGMKLVTGRYTGTRMEILDQRTVSVAPVNKNRHVYIDVPGILAQIKSCVKELRQQGIALQSMGIDTFGNGYGLLDQDLKLMALPYFYKDSRTKGVLAKMAKWVPLQEQYQSTGIFPTDIRVLSQLYYESRHSSSLFHQCRWMLLLPDLLNMQLTGRLQCEISMASVANLLDKQGEQWNRPLMERLGIRTDILPPLVQGGSTAGPLAPPAEKELGGPLWVTTVASHDTESALLAAPGLDTDSVFASIGTSLIFGTKTNYPMISPLGYAGAFKTVKGPFSYSLCRDFNAMWLFEKCMARWRAENPQLTYQHVMDACTAAEQEARYCNVCDPMLRIEQKDMLSAIRDYCQETGQSPPESLGETANFILDGIVLQALWSFRQVQQITGRCSYQKLVAIGGGIKNTLLIQRLSDALGLPVVTGSTVSSALGNLMMQLYTTGELADYRAIQRMVQNSWTSNVFYPRPEHQDKWEKALLQLSNIDKIRGIWR